MNQRTVSFQGLRVLMILGVVCLHTYMRPIFGAGEELVSFFFVVSGFLYKDETSWIQFISHKFKKLFPFYWLVLMLVVLIQFVRNQNVLNVGFLGHLFLLQSWVPSVSLTYAFKYVGAAWFLSSLMFCYLLAGPLYKMIRKFSKKNVLVIFCLAYLSICLCRYFEHGIVYGVWMAYACPIFRLLEYIMGMIASYMMAKTRYAKCSIKMEILSICVLIFYVINICSQTFGGGKFFVTCDDD